VVDFDGRNTLDDVHWMMHKILNIGDGDDHLYAFFMSGRYWDKSSRYIDPRSDGARADQALLFRLGLKPGQHFVYLFDFGDELRYDINVVSVTDTQAPLPEPVLIESVGEVPARPNDFDDGDYEGSEDNEDDEDDEDGEDSEDSEDDQREPDPALAEPLALARPVLEQLKALDALGEDADAEVTRPLLVQVGEAALALLRVIDGHLKLFSAVDRECQFDLIDPMLDLPRRISEANETELAVRVADALRFAAPSDMLGEMAIVYARAGDRQRALDITLRNLEHAFLPYVAEYQAGYVYRELGENDAAEAYFRRAFALAETKTDRAEATLRIATHLIDTGRATEAAAFVEQQRAAANAAPSAATGVRARPSVGRNDPCPCGSGKKYKKCHGA